MRSRNGTSFTDGVARVRSMTPLGRAMRRTSHERNRMGRGGHAKEELENPKTTLFLYWPACRCAQSTFIFDLFFFSNFFFRSKGGVPAPQCKFVRYRPVSVRSGLRPIRDNTAVFILASLQMCQWRPVFKGVAGCTKDLRNVN